MPTKKNKTPATKRTVVVHKKAIDVKSIYQLLATVENTIYELSRMYAELPVSDHKDVGGRMKPTTKQKEVARQIEKAQKRAERLMRLIEREGK